MRRPLILLLLALGYLALAVVPAFAQDDGASVGEGVATFTTVALFTGIVVTFGNLVRYLRAKDWNSVLSIVLACAGGVGAVLLASVADVTENMVLIVGAPPLGVLDLGSVILLGCGIGMAAPVVVDFRKAIDNSTSAEKPPLVG